MRNLFLGSNPNLSASKSYLYLQDPFVGSFSNYFLQSKTSQQNSINLDDYIEDQAYTFFVEDTQNIKLRRVRKINSPKNESFTMKYITIRDESSFQLYLKEADILCQLEHKNIVRAFGYGVKILPNNSGKILGILMEFLENNLQKKINEKISKHKLFTKEQIFSIIGALISGILYLQFKRIFHANIKPENIMISGNIIKISNFSSSQDFSNDRSTITNELVATNQNNHGSLFWSPEFRRAFLESKTSVSFNVFKVDSFALGLLIAHIACLAPIETLYKILEKCEVSPDKMSLFKNIESKYDRGVVDLIRDLSNFDEDERKIVVSLCFAPKKSYEKLVCKEIAQFYNLNKTDKNLYKCIKVLGSGGFGEVKEVKQTKTNQRFAEKTIKFIDSRCLIDSMEEVLVNASMDHENIVKFYYYDIEEIPTRSDFYNLYCYIELMDRPLDQEIKKRSKMFPKDYFNISEVDNLLLSMAKAMKYMQEIRSTSHSDIKPQNILISSDNRTYKLCDFGISRPNLNKKEATAAMTIKGSPLYLAPELREENGLVPRVIYNPFKSDIFSLGLSILHMVTLENFHRDKIKEKENCIGWFLSEEATAKLLERYDKGLLHILKSMLNYDFRERMDYLEFYKKVYARWKLKNMQNNKEKYEIIRTKIGGSNAKKKRSENYFTTQINNLQDSLKIYEEIGDHEGVASSLTTLGNLYKELGIPDKAQAYYEKSLEIGCHTLGFEHPRIATMLNNLGIIYIEFGAFPRAKNYFLQAIDIQIKNFGQNDQKIITFQLNLASLYLKQDDLESAIKFYKESLKLAYKCYEPDNLEIAIILNHLGSCYRRYRKKEKYELALGLYQEALGIYKKYDETPEKYRRNYAELLQNLNKIHVDLKNNNEAKSFLEESVKIYIELYGQYHKQVGFSYDRLGTIYKKLGDFCLALENQLKAVKIIEFLQNKNNENEIKQNNKSSKSKSPKGNRNKNQNLDIPKKFSAFSANSSPTNSNSKKNKKWSFFESAQDFLNSGNSSTNTSERRISSDPSPINVLDLVGVKNNLGIIYRDMKEFEKAKESFQKALSIMRGNKGVEDETKLVEVLNNLGSCLIELGDNIERINRAKELFEEGIGIAGKRSERSMKNNLKIMEYNLAIVNRKIKIIAKKK